ncbi:MAG: metal ABC transporter permease [Chloroflexota bacterium]|nr:metal ABC transporter permease [Chloroflexota bacterium]
MATVIAVAIKIVRILHIVALQVMPPARRFASSPEQIAVAAALAGVISIVEGCRLGPARHAVRPSMVVAALLLFTVTRSRLLKKSRKER